ncbi:MAG: DNA-binding protein [Deltaproteobacteria bacterium]|jgi:predicted DNA-binding protein with PD1-like motif|nr:DNA-binding protein [Deltaproteobacteria bacterium]
MRYSQAKSGRIFVLRLEHEEILHETIERFAQEQHIERAVVWALGGADHGSQLVVGPENGEKQPFIPLKTSLLGTHEAFGVGTIFPDSETGAPILHMHMSCGRTGHSITGCVRAGVKVWHVMEVVIQELVENTATRVLDYTGFKLLTP